MMNDELFLISRRCLEILRQCGKRVAFAESCTGGLLSKCMTDHSGASDVFECGVVSYSGKIKHKLLGVNEKTLRAYGEVSEHTAAEMSQGIVSLSGADIGVGITGIAGPTGATANKKVGLIYASITFAGETEVHKLELYQDVSREERRIKAAIFVLNRIIELLTK